MYRVAFEHEKIPTAPRYSAAGTASALTAILDREGHVAVSFFGVPQLPRLVTPRISDGNGLRIASLLDLAGMYQGVGRSSAPEKKGLSRSG
jgi:hypothetical protein